MPIEPGTGFMPVAGKTVRSRGRLAVARVMPDAVISLRNILMTGGIKMSVDLVRWFLKPIAMFGRFSALQSLPPPSATGA